MCGSQAAWPTHGLALGEDGGHDRVLGPHDRRLVEVHALAAEPVASRISYAPFELDLDAELLERVDVRVEPAAADDVAAGRRDGDASEAREQRAGEKERRADLARELGVEIGLRRRRADRRGRRFGPVHSTSAPRSARSSTIVSTSRMRGTFESATSSEASTHAARIGSAPFLFPEARTVPVSGRPPSMTKDCIARRNGTRGLTGSLRVSR